MISDCNQIVRLLIKSRCIVKSSSNEFTGVILRACQNLLSFKSSCVVNRANSLLSALTHSQKPFARRQSQRRDSFTAFDSRDVRLGHGNAFLFFIEFHLLDDNVVATYKDQSRVVIGNHTGTHVWFYTYQKSAAKKDVIGKSLKRKKDWFNYYIEVEKLKMCL
jgi:hypothetical protein